MTKDNQAHAARRAAKKAGLILIKSRKAYGYDIGDGYCLHDGYAPVFGDSFHLSAEDAIECCKEWAQRDEAVT